MAITICDIGDLVRLSNALTVTSDGSAIDPGTLVMVLELPNGTQTTYTYGGSPAITKDSTGNYHVDYTPTMAGIHSARWTSTGNGQASEEQRFQVQPRRVD